MQTMAGTLMPEEQARILQQQQPLIDALRGGGGGALAFNPSANTGFQGGQGMQGGNQLDAFKTGQSLGGAIDKMDLGQYFGSRGAATDFVNNYNPSNYG